jgi:membrane associated rhomboid family serine protease
LIPLHDDIRSRRFALATAALIAANVAVFAFQLLLPRWGLTLEAWYYLAGARPFELAHQVDLPPFGAVPWWATLFSALFVHVGWVHLAFNMLYLWIFGNNVEDAMSRARFVAFYLACGMVATATQVVMDPASDVPIVGASGAVAGVLGAYLVLHPRARVLTVVPLLFLFPVFSVPAWVLLGIWFAVQAVEGWLSLSGGPGGVAFFAHIGGFVAGVLLVRLFAPRPRPAARRRA